MKIALFVFLMSSFSYAQVDSRSKVIVNSLDQNSHIDGLDKEHFEVVDGLAPQKSHNRTPSPDEIQTYFKNANLTVEVSALDQFDKDFLYRRAKSYPLEKLVKSYPKIPEDKLKKLKDLVRK